MSRSTTLRLTLCGLLFAFSGCRRSAESSPPVPARPAPRPAEREPAGDPLCGTAGRPDCPLQAWMDSHLNAGLSNGDFAGMARDFKQLADDPPPGFNGWAESALAGAEAADRQDQPGVKAACDACHEDFRERYRATIRHRPLRAVSDLR